MNEKTNKIIINLIAAILSIVSIISIKGGLEKNDWKSATGAHVGRPRKE